MKMNVLDGLRTPRTASGPAFVPSTKAPPRVNAPGPPTAVLAPERHIWSLLRLPQLEHCVESGTQSATHSSRLPTMSKAPRADTQALREPVRTTRSEEHTSELQSHLNL